MSDFELDPTFAPDADGTEKKDIETNDEGFAPDAADQGPAAEGDLAPLDAEAPANEPAGPSTDAEPQAAPDADAAQAEGSTDEAAAEGTLSDAEEGEANSEAEAAPVADDGNVVHPEAIQPPLAEASSIAPALPSDSTGPATGEAGDVVGVEAGAEADKEAGSDDSKAEGDDKAGPVPATPAPLDEIRAGAQSGDGEPDASAGIVPQPKAEDALADRPLSGIASDEARGAVDAMPAAAQQHMGQWVKGVHEAEPAQDGQLPTTADLPGTPMDATGVGTYSDRGLTKADEALETRAQDGDEQAKEAIKDGGGLTGSDIGEDGDEADQASDAGLNGDTGADDADFEGGDDEGLETSDAGADLGADAGGDDSEDGYFGAPKVQNGPLVDVAKDGVAAFKQAAEQAALAQSHFQNVPFAVLDMEHKDLVSNLRVVMGDMLRLAAQFFDRNDR